VLVAVLLVVVLVRLVLEIAVIMLMVTTTMMMTILTMTMDMAVITRTYIDKIAAINITDTSLLLLIEGADKVVGKVVG
jgi:hypothetical protein